MVSHALCRQFGAIDDKAQCSISNICPLTIEDVCMARTDHTPLSPSHCSRHSSSNRSLYRSCCLNAALFCYRFCFPFRCSLRCSAIATAQLLVRPFRYFLAVRTGAPSKPTPCWMHASSKSDCCPCQRQLALRIEPFAVLLLPPLFL